MPDGKVDSESVQARNGADANLKGATDQDLVDSLIDSRAANSTSSHGTLAQGRDGSGNLTPVRESIPADNPADAIHAETQVIKDLTGKPKPHTIAVDQTPCSNCSSSLKNADVDKVIVPQNPVKPDLTPKSAAVKAADGKGTVQPKEIDLN